MATADAAAPTIEAAAPTEVSTPPAGQRPESSTPQRQERASKSRTERSHARREWWLTHRPKGRLTEEQAREKLKDEEQHRLRRQEARYAVDQYVDKRQHERRLLNPKRLLVGMAEAVVKWNLARRVTRAMERNGINVTTEDFVQEACRNAMTRIRRQNRENLRNAAQGAREISQARLQLQGLAEGGSTTRMERLTPEQVAQLDGTTREIYTRIVEPYLQAHQDIPKGEKLPQPTETEIKQAQEALAQIHKEHPELNMGDLNSSDFARGMLLLAREVRTAGITASDGEKARQLMEGKLYSTGPVAEMDRIYRERIILMGLQWGKNIGFAIAGIAMANPATLPLWLVGTFGAYMIINGRKLSLERTVRTIDYARGTLAPSPDTAHNKGLLAAIGRAWSVDWNQMQADGTLGTRGDMVTAMLTRSGFGTVTGAAMFFLGHSPVGDWVGHEMRGAEDVISSTGPGHVVGEALGKTGETIGNGLGKAGEGIGHVLGGTGEIVGSTGPGKAVEDALGHVGEIIHGQGGTGSSYDKLQALAHSGSRADDIPHCFVAGTLILMADGSSKSIEEVKVGETVLSYDEETREVVAKEVLEVVAPMHDALVTIYFINGTKNTNTLDHPYLTVEKGWVSYDPEATEKKYGLQVKKLANGDKVYAYADGKLEEVAVEKLAVVHGETQTYNLSNIADTHTFFANGIVVHNKVDMGTSHANEVTVSTPTHPENTPIVDGGKPPVPSIDATRSFDMLHSHSSVSTGGYHWGDPSIHQNPDNLYNSDGQLVGQNAYIGTDGNIHMDGASGDITITPDHTATTGLNGLEHYNSSDIHWEGDDVAHDWQSYHSYTIPDSHGNPIGVRLAYEGQNVPHGATSVVAAMDQHTGQTIFLENNARIIPGDMHDMVKVYVPDGHGGLASQDVYSGTVAHWLGVDHADLKTYDALLKAAEYSNAHGGALTNVMVNGHSIGQISWHGTINANDLQQILHDRFGVGPGGAPVNLRMGGGWYENGVFHMGASNHDFGVPSGHAGIPPSDAYHASPVHYSIPKDSLQPIKDTSDVTGPPHVVSKTSDKPPWENFGDWVGGKIGGGIGEGGNVIHGVEHFAGDLGNRDFGAAGKDVLEGGGNLLGVVRDYPLVFAAISALYSRNQSKKGHTKRALVSRVAAEALAGYGLLGGISRLPGYINAAAGAGLFEGSRGVGKLISRTPKGAAALTALGALPKKLGHGVGSVASGAVHLPKNLLDRMRGKGKPPKGSPIPLTTGPRPSQEKAKDSALNDARSGLDKSIPEEVTAGKKGQEREKAINDYYDGIAREAGLTFQPGGGREALINQLGLLGVPAKDIEAATKGKTGDAYKEALMNLIKRKTLEGIPEKARARILGEEAVTDSALGKVAGVSAADLYDALHDKKDNEDAAAAGLIGAITLAGARERGLMQSIGREMGLSDAEMDKKSDGEITTLIGQKLLANGLRLDDIVKDPPIPAMISGLGKNLSDDEKATAATSIGVNLREKGLKGYFGSNVDAGKKKRALTALKTQLGMDNASQDEVIRAAAERGVSREDIVNGDEGVISQKILEYAFNQAGLTDDELGELGKRIMGGDANPISSHDLAERLSKGIVAKSLRMPIVATDLTESIREAEADAQRLGRDILMSDVIRHVNERVIGRQLIAANMTDEEIRNLAKAYGVPVVETSGGQLNGKGTLMAIGKKLGGLGVDSTETGALIEGVQANGEGHKSAENIQKVLAKPLWVAVAKGIKDEGERARIAARVLGVEGKSGGITPLEFADAAIALGIDPVKVANENWDEGERTKAFEEAYRQAIFSNKKRLNDQQAQNLSKTMGGPHANPTEARDWLSQQFVGISPARLNEVFKEGRPPREVEEDAKVLALESQLRRHVPGGSGTNELEYARSLAVTYGINVDDATTAGEVWGQISMYLYKLGLVPTADTDKAFATGEAESSPGSYASAVAEALELPLATAIIKNSKLAGPNDIAILDRELNSKAYKPSKPLRTPQDLAQALIRAGMTPQKLWQLLNGATSTDEVVTRNGQDDSNLEKLPTDTPSRLPKRAQASRDEELESLSQAVHITAAQPATPAPAAQPAQPAPGQPQGPLSPEQQVEENRAKLGRGIGIPDARLGEFSQAIDDSVTEVEEALDNKEDPEEIVTRVTQNFAQSFNISDPQALKMLRGAISSLVTEVKHDMDLQQAAMQAQAASQASGGSQNPPAGSQGGGAPVPPTPAGPAPAGSAPAAPASTAGRTSGTPQPIGGPSTQPMPSVPAAPPATPSGPPPLGSPASLANAAAATAGNVGSDTLAGVPPGSDPGDSLTGLGPDNNT